MDENVKLGVSETSQPAAGNGVPPEGSSDFVCEETCSR